MRLKLNQYICKHDYRHIAKSKSVSENLWVCDKCGVYYVQHWGMGIGYKCKLQPSGSWEFNKGVIIWN